ncbi:PAS domain S-box protein [Brevundimonas sp. 2R-24]|uniref:histidine kinase n=1 Tax=Peiella sedimenti TaxID=3061083 RepID=A0ABT8SMJ8_9CAUL|nr:PAS domain S-box protein [Caulobacteraceae bacterium XZ-24]
MKNSALLALKGGEAALKVDVLALIADSVICTDEDGCVLVFNPAAEKSFGYSAGEVIGRHVEMLLPLRHRAEHARQVREFGSEGNSTHRLMGPRREVWGRRKNGDEFPAEAMVSRQIIDGQTILTVVHRDITARKELEDLREAMAREMDHRMRNVLSVVHSLVSISAADASNVEEFRDSLVGRLKALAASQGALRFGEEKHTSLNEVFLAELAQYQTQGGANVAIDGPSVSVGPKAAQLLALAVHELATNSAKYGALSSPTGRVIVATAFKDIGGEPLFLIEWREEGGPPVKRPERQGFGTSLIKQVVARALRADVALDYRSDGLICRMTMPHAALEADQ